MCLETLIPHLLNQFSQNIIIVLCCIMNISKFKHTRTWQKLIILCIYSTRRSYAISQTALGHD